MIFCACCLDESFLYTLRAERWADLFSSKKKKRSVLPAMYGFTAKKRKGSTIAIGSVRTSEEVGRVHSTVQGSAYAREPFQSLLSSTKQNKLQSPAKSHAQKKKPYHSSASILLIHKLAKPTIARAKHTSGQRHTARGTWLSSCNGVIPYSLGPRANPSAWPYYLLIVLLPSTHDTRYSLRNIASHSRKAAGKNKKFFHLFYPRFTTSATAQQ